MSGDHIESLQTMQRCILDGSQYCESAPRGDGKSSRFLAACLWAILYGHRRYIFLVAATGSAAKGLLKAMLVELADNPEVAKDWPGIAVLFAAAFDRPNRATYLLANGAPVRMECKTSKVVFPSIVNSQEPSSGAVIEVAGLTGSLRGPKHTLPGTGEVIRPDLVLLDDPQTDRSAKSVSQCDVRESTIDGAVSGLAGPDSSLAGFMAVTVITPDDLASRYLDRKRHPEWKGVKRSLVKRWPDADAMWSKYMDLYRTGLALADTTEAFAFYRDNQFEMDRGAEVSWDDRIRKDKGEISAVQTAYNLRVERGDCFWCEYQNEPIRRNLSLYQQVVPSLFLRCHSGVPAREIPHDCTWVTAFCDVNPSKGLWWMVCGWRQDTTGYIVDYGLYPESGDGIWSPKTAGGLTEAQAVHKALAELTEALTLPGRYVRDGRTATIDALAVDAGDNREAVFGWCSSTKSATIVVPSLGRAASQYRDQKNGIIKLGDRWMVTQLPGDRRVLVHDSDNHRLAVHQSFLLTPGSPGGLNLPGSDPKANALLAQHLAGERLQEKIVGTTAERWVWKPSGPGARWDWLDCLVGCRVVFSWLSGRSVLSGASVEPTVAPQPLQEDQQKQQQKPQPPPKPKASPVSYSSRFGRY
jgi:hypothetical protein